MRVLMTKVHYKSGLRLGLVCNESRKHSFKKKKETYSTVMLCIKCLRLVTFWLIRRNPSRRLVMYSRCHGTEWALHEYISCAGWWDQQMNLIVVQILNLMLKSHVFNLQTLRRCSLPFLRPTWEEEAGLLGRSRWSLPLSWEAVTDWSRGSWCEVWMGGEAFRVSAPSVHVCLSAGAVTIPYRGHTERRREG